MNNAEMATFFYLVKMTAFFWMLLNDKTKQQKLMNLIGARSAMGLRSSGGRAKRPSFGDRFFKERKKVRKHEALFMIIEKILGRHIVRVFLK